MSVPETSSTGSNNAPGLTLSVVIPCFNESQVIAETHRRLSAVLGGLPLADYELVFVDDGSSDETPAALRTLQAADPHVRVLVLSRNFGHQPAVTAGLEYASGGAVIIIDADLQDPPEVIPEMIDLWQSGNDVVYGVRTERAGETAFKRWTARVFYRLINRLSDVPIPLDTGDFRLLDRRVVDVLVNMPERDRFIRGMAAWAGFRQAPVHYARAPRFAGEAGYPLPKMLRFAADGIFSFSRVPLQLAVYIGLAAAGFAVLGIIYALVLRLFTDVWVTGWTLLFIAILFMGGVQLMFLGVIGAYLGRVYGEVKRRPLYVVSEAHGFADRPVAGIRASHD